MAVELATAYVNLVPSAKNIGAQLTQELGTPVTKAAKQTSDDVGGVFGKLQGKLTDGFKEVGVAIAGAFVAKKVLDFFHSSIDAASDLNESLSKTRVVFGDNSKAVEDFAKSAASSLGQSRQQALEATSTFGNLFVALGLGGKPAADMSTNLVKLASDLASFNNVDPAQALDALRSGLVGETEPLRQFGVNMNDATLHEEALKLGLISTVKDALTPAVKAQSAYGLILEQTKTAQGDFARTSDGLANQQRILGARFQDLQANLGQALLPVMKVVVGVAADMAGFFGKNTDIVIGLAAVVGGALTIALGRYLVQQSLILKEKLAEFFETAALKALYLKDALSVAGLGASAMLVGLGLVVAVLGALVINAQRSQQAVDEAQRTFATDYVKSLDNASTKTETLTKHVKNLANEAYVGNQTTNEGAAAVKVYTDEISKNRSAVQASTAAQKDASSTAKDSTGVLAQLSAQTGLHTDVVDALAKKLKIDLTSGTSAANEQFFTEAQRLTVASPAALNLQDALAKLSEITATATDRSKAFKDALDLLIGGNIDAEKAVVSLYDKLDVLGTKLVENGANLDFRTTKGRADLTVIQDTVTAIRNHIESMQAAGQPAADLQRALEGDTRAFDDQLRKAGITTNQIAALNKQYGLVPGSLNTVITADVTGATLSLQQLYDKAVEVAAHIPFAQQELVKIGKGHAAGGPVKPGYVYPVGEKGPEMFAPSAPGVIIPNGGGSVGMPAGGNTYHIDVEAGISDPAAVGQAVVGAIQQYEYRAGRGWRQG